MANPKQEFNCYIEGNKLDFISSREQARFKTYTTSLKNKTKKRIKLVIEIKEFEFKRTSGQSNEKSNQNGLYWKYLSIIEDDTGNNMYHMHEYFKRIFLIPQFIDVFGKQIKIPGSTRNMKRKQFSEYMEKICALTDIPIPDIYKY